MNYPDLIADREHFAEAAYRDGEWRCMLGDSGCNVNGEVYAPELGEALRNTLLHPAGQWCTLFDRPENVRKRADVWIAEHQPDVTWTPDRAIMQAVVAGEAAPWSDAIRTRRVIIVGPAHLARLTLFPMTLIQVPPSDAWRSVDETCVRVLDIVEPDDLVLFAAGMASNLMIHRLWPMVDDVTLYDVGAALDPFVGVWSRSIYRNPVWQRDVLPKNPGG